MKKTITKLILTSCLCVMAWQVGATGQAQAEEQGQSVNQTEEIPLDEAHFPCKLLRETISLYDGDFNGSLSKKEIEKIESLMLDDNDEEPYSLEGVEYLTNLQSVQYRGKLPEKGTLKNNKKLKRVYLEKSHSPYDWKEIEDVFFVENLERIYVYEVSGIKNIEFSSTKNLKSLEIRYCGDLTKLNVSKATNLQKLSIRNTPIKSLDLSKNKKLEEVSVTFGDWYDCYRIVPKDSKYKMRFFRKMKNKCKIKFASGSNIKNLEYFTKDKELDITRLKKLKTISIPKDMKVKTTTKWYEKNKNKLKYYADGILQKNLKEYTKKQMTKLQVMKKPNRYYRWRYDDDQY